VTIEKPCARNIQPKRPDESRDCVLSIPDGWYRIKSRAQIGSSREDKFMKIEIEYCGQ